MLSKKLKYWALTILGAPLLLLAPLVKRSVRKLEEKMANDPESVSEEIRNYHYFTKLDNKAYEELKNGDYAKAKKSAKKLLDISKEYRDDWNYGNALHHSNTILGLLSIKEGRLEEAVTYLLRSADTPGSPQLGSYGPSTCLAMELLLKNKDDEVVRYLEKVESFWGMGYKELPLLLEDIRSGEIPEKWQRLKY